MGYMGWVSLWTNSFFERFLMFFRQPSKYPKGPLTDNVDRSTMHLFTLIQIALFGTMYAVKSIAISFPIVIALCIPIRSFVLPKIFDKKSLVFLDGEEEDIKSVLESRSPASSDTFDVEGADLKPTTLG